MDQQLHGAGFCVHLSILCCCLLIHAFHLFFSIKALISQFAEFFCFSLALELNSAFFNCFHNHNILGLIVHQCKHFNFHKESFKISKDLLSELASS